MNVESNDAITIATLSNWLKNLSQTFQPMRSKTNSNRTLYAPLFPCFEPVTCNLKEFRLVHRAACCCCGRSNYYFGIGFSKDI